jgi:hypothetical protein
LLTPDTLAFVEKLKFYPTLLSKGAAARKRLHNCAQSLWRRMGDRRTPAKQDFLSERLVGEPTESAAASAGFAPQLSA